MLVIFFDVILVSNYHGCKEEVANELNTTLFGRHYLQNCKAITFRKIAIIPNGNKLMFQVIFIFSDWILIEQIIASSSPSVLGKTDFQKILAGVLSGGLRHE